MAVAGQMWEVYRDLRVNRETCHRAQAKGEECNKTGGGYLCRRSGCPRATRDRASGSKAARGSLDICGHRRSFATGRLLCLCRSWLCRGFAQQLRCLASGNCGGAVCGRRGAAGERFCEQVVDRCGVHLDRSTTVLGGRGRVGNGRRLRCCCGSCLCPLGITASLMRTWSVVRKLCCGAVA